MMMPSWCHALKSLWTVRCSDAHAVARRNSGYRWRSIFVGSSPAIWLDLKQLSLIPGAFSILGTRAAPIFENTNMK